MVADKVMEALSWLKRHEFCVGNIAPDCNIPNEDWTAFTPSREITHWMQAGKRKNADDCKRFYEEYIAKTPLALNAEKMCNFEKLFDT